MRVIGYGVCKCDWLSMMMPSLWIVWYPCYVLRVHVSCLTDGLRSPNSFNLALFRAIWQHEGLGGGLSLSLSLLFNTTISSEASMSDDDEDGCVECGCCVGCFGFERCVYCCSKMELGTTEKYSRCKVHSQFSSSSFVGMLDACT
jgi:hypothetical protein